MFHTKDVDMFKIYWSAQLQMPRSNGSFITVKPKSQYRIHVVLILYYMVQKYFNKICIFFIHIFSTKHSKLLYQVVLMSHPPLPC